MMEAMAMERNGWIWEVFGCRINTSWRLIEQWDEGEGGVKKKP